VNDLLFPLTNAFFVSRKFPQSRLRDIEEELKLERDVRYRQEKELTNLRIDFDEVEQQLDEVTNARDREVEANKRFFVFI